ncbi:MAG: TrmB family transcriptional regulator, partial [Oscillochloris sp.]|nr:TrmB family transcriptional regulator [Oscillochloris sp.]
MNNLLEQLEALGMTEYEAKVYLALLGENPATGYQVSKNSGVPRSMVYEALGRLEARGAALKSLEEKATLYRPVPPTMLLDRYERESRDLASSLRTSLLPLYNQEETGRLWNFSGRREALSYAGELIDAAKTELMLVLADADVTALRARIEAAYARGVALGVILTGDLPFALGIVGRLPVVVSQGRLTGDLKVHGSLAHPDMDGTLAMADLFLSVPGWVTSPVGPINAPVLVSGKHLSLLAPSVSAGDATLMVEASADLVGWLPRDLHARAKTLTASPLSAKAKILGINVSGQALLDLTFGYSGGIASISGSVGVQKATVVIDPLGFRKKGKWTPSTYFDVDLSLAVGPGVKVYFPSTELPVVMGYADPASALTVSY